MIRLPPTLDAADIRHFLDTFLYDEEAFFIDEIMSVDPEARRIEARMDTTRPLPLSRHQRTGPGHPAHVAAAEMLAVTGSLGCLHAWLFHGCRWDEGWSGFGNRIHRADFKSLARLGPPLDLSSVETKTRVGEKRVVIRYEFRFVQDETLVYAGDQSAMFFRDALL